jgi:hypothetical protein
MVVSILDLKNGAKMQIGTKPPAWAQNLLNKWVIFDDLYFKLNNVVAYIYYVDFFEKHDTSTQVRIFATPIETAIKETKSGKIIPGVWATYITENKVQIIDTPKNLEDWTKEAQKC